ncbi:hypothetical protein [Xanthomonas graminis]|uniref:hypothetical protein n=1 Tax=Xanthomonas graminis TaxID=3390026 RepID=UPI00163E52EE|nr:hypothetical protein [Xanthomonas translucens]
MADEARTRHCTDLTTSIQTTASLRRCTSQRAGDFSPPAQPRFMHMDVPAWNLMARNDHGQWTLSGPLDFGDAIVGHCDLLELLTPLICGWRKATRCWRRHCWTPAVCATATPRRPCAAGAWPPHGSGPIAIAACACSRFR